MGLSTYVCTYCGLTVDRDRDEKIGQFHDNARCIKEGQLYRRHPAEQVLPKGDDARLLGPCGFTGWAPSLSELMAGITAAITWRWENDPELRGEGGSDGTHR